MIKAGVTKTLQESLVLQQDLARSYQLLDTLPPDDFQKRAPLVAHIDRVKKRLWKLPNYNANGLVKIMKFFKMEKHEAVQPI